MPSIDAHTSVQHKLEISGVSLRYGNAAGGSKLVLDNVNLRVAEGEFVSVVGASGCGKSTLLKLISGLQHPTAGTVRLDGVPVRNPPPGVGFMFQRDTLLPWSTTTENINVGFDLAGVSREERTTRLPELIKFLGLEGFESHYPAALSGGMRQRVSLGRLLAYGPALYLMDEPFGALDAQTKLVMGRELLRIWSSARKSVVFVTHDIEEAVALSDRVVVMSPRPGRIKREVIIDLPRPRDILEIRKTPAFRELADRLWHELMSDE